MRRAIGWVDDYDGTFYVYRFWHSPKYGWGLVGIARISMREEDL